MMGSLLMLVGVAVLAAFQFGGDGMREKAGGNLAAIGFAILVAGALLNSFGGDQACGSAWGTRGSYEDC